MSTGNKIVVSEELAQNYARIKNVSMEEAYRKLEENFTKEAEEIDLRQQYGVLIKAFRDMSPKLNGVVMRESDIALRIQQVESKVLGFQGQINLLKDRLDFERDIYKKSMEILNGIVEEDKKTMVRIASLESRQSLPFKIWNKIKCLLSS
mgnify:CR=1 FL=1